MSKLPESVVKQRALEDFLISGKPGDSYTYFRGSAGATDADLEKLFHTARKHHDEGKCCLFQRYMGDGSYDYFLTIISEQTERAITKLCYGIDIEEAFRGEKQRWT